MTKNKIFFITNICAHYVILLFELLAKEYDIDFLFTGGQETYWDKKNKTWTGNFRGRYLKGFFIAPKLKVTPGLFQLFFAPCEIFIKTIDDRIAILFVFLVAKLRRKSFILWTGIWHHPETLFHKMTFGLTKFIYHHSDAVIVYGEHVRKYLLSLGVKPEKIFIELHSVDNAIFNSDVSLEQKRQLRKKLDLGDQKIVLCVGRLEECKGLNYLIEAMAQFSVKNTRLLLIGSGHEKEKLGQQAKELSVACLFLDHVPNAELPQYYALADVFVLPSITTKDFKEPWGLVINEAMNQGCPVIATDSVGAALGGLVEEGKTGFIVPERDSNALRVAIERLINDPALAEKMRMATKTKIKTWGPAQTMEGFNRAIEFVLKRS